jgi:hypothetical protein
VKFLTNEKGIALVTSLMLTLLTLTISMVMLYMVLQSTRMSGAQKRYKNSLDAAVGGADILTMDALPYLLGFAMNPIVGTDYFKTNLISSMPGLQDTTIGVTDSCLQAKLTTKNWAAACVATSSSVDAKVSPDFTFTLQSQVPGLNAPSGFRVYTKIVSTTPGSTDMSGRNLEGQATTGSPPGDVGAPYLYRIEVSSEKVTNPSERANLSLLYAY